MLDYCNHVNIFSLSLSFSLFFFFFFFERRITEPDAEILLLACFSRDRHSGIVCILIAIDPCVPE